MIGESAVVGDEAKLVKEVAMGGIVVVPGNVSQVLRGCLRCYHGNPRYLRYTMCTGNVAVHIPQKILGFRDIELHNEAPLSMGVFALVCGSDCHLWMIFTD